MDKLHGQLGSVGQDQSSKDVVDLYDKAAGKYEETVMPIPADERLPLKQMPQAPDPSPFTLGPLAPGGRGE